MNLYSLTDGVKRQKMRTLVVIISIVLLFFTSIINIAIALPNGTETPITTRPTCAYQSAPAISGDKIVWEDIRDPSLSQIYSYDLISGVEHPVNSSLNVQYHPAIFGNTVVWAEPDLSGNASKIVRFETTSLTRDEYTSHYDSGTYEYNFPKISGTTIVWQDYNISTSNWDISIVRDTGSQPELIVYGDGDQKHPEIYQDSIVFENWTGSAYNSPSHIWLYNLSNDTAVPISERFHQETFPHIFSKRIVWEASNLTGDGTHIHLFDQGSVTRLTPRTDNPFDQLHPAIYGNRVVVEDYRRSASADVYLYDLLLSLIHI